MANIYININDDYIIDIQNQIGFRDCEREDFETDNQHSLSKKLALKRTYKALCSICSSLTSTYNKNRITICNECESKRVDVDIQNNYTKTKIYPLPCQNSNCISKKSTLLL